jgi:hypothetical protein
MSDKELSRRVGVAGTPLFMPPESLNHLTRRKGADGEGDLRSTLTPALDVWGLGAVVYYVLAGRDIFLGDSDWELEELADVVNASDGVQLPEGVRASYAARDFLSRCLERRPGQRAAARELLAHPWLRGAASRAEVEAALAADAAAASRRPGSKCGSVSSVGSGATGGAARRRAPGSGAAGGAARRPRGARVSSSSSPAAVGPRPRAAAGAPGACAPPAAGAAVRAPRLSASSSRPGSGGNATGGLSSSSNLSSSSAGGGAAAHGEGPKPSGAAAAPH